MAPRIAVHTDTEAVAISYNDGLNWTVNAPNADGTITTIELDYEGMALDETEEWVEGSIVTPVRSAR